MNASVTTPNAARASVEAEAPPRRILVVHQSAELYGSDRSLLELLADSDRRRVDWVVCLPGEGALAQALRVQGIEVHILALLKISRRLLSLSGLWSAGFRAAASLRSLDRLVAGRRIDLVYTNTLAVFDGMLWAMFRRRPHVWHVREIIRKPRLVSLALRRIAHFGADRLICNSGPTLAWLTGAGKTAAKASVVWNGVQAQPLAREARISARVRLGLHRHLPMLLMVGRVNHWKGQDLLLEAVERLTQCGCREFQLVLVGGAVPGQENLMDRLLQLVGSSPASARIIVREFAEDILDYYRAADCLVVPSREPEPFGRVAIEAMSLGVAVVAAGHGGLTEIVSHGHTGLLFAPNDAGALSSALERVLAEPAVRDTWGRNGHSRQQEFFSLTAYREAMGGVFSAVLQ